MASLAHRHSPADALRAAVRGSNWSAALRCLDALPGDDAAAWCVSWRERLGDTLGDWLGGLERSTGLAWLHRLVPWTEVRVIEGATIAGRGGGVPLAEFVPQLRGDHRIQITEPCALSSHLSWSPRAAQQWACDCAERAIGHADGVLPQWEAAHPGDKRPRQAIEAARACVIVVRRGGSPDEIREAKHAAYAAAYAAYADAADAADAAYAAYAAYAAAYAADAAAYAADAAAYAAAYAADAAAYARSRRHDAWRQARAAEREWQAGRLWGYLCGVVGVAAPAPALLTPVRYHYEPLRAGPLGERVGGHYVVGAALPNGTVWRIGEIERHRRRWALTPAAGPETYRTRDEAARALWAAYRRTP